MPIFASMKRSCWIGLLFLLAMAACNTPTREAKRMVRRAQLLADTLPDSTVRLIDSVLHMPVSFSERERMDMALLQAEALLGDRGQDISPVMDDDFFDDHATLSTSPELERAADYYAKKKQFDKAARAALYSGFVQQHYDEKETAMRSFKEAEHYGIMAGDSLTMARAEYKMGKMLLNNGMYDETLLMAESANKNFGTHYYEKAMVYNLMAVRHLVLGEYENAELCLHQSLIYAKQSHSDIMERKVLNNYAVLYQRQREYDSAIKCLRIIANKSNHGHSELLLYSNLGDAFAEIHEMDSATVYFRRVDSLLPITQARNETKVSAYISLSKFAESQDNDSMALFYRKQYEEWLNKVRDEREQNNIYGIQQKYDYGALQNMMNQRIIRRQRLAIFLSIVVVLVMMAFVISQIRLAKIRKQEAEAKASLFHFMQQNKELQQKSEQQKQNQIFLTQKHKESEQAYEDLLKEKQRQEQAASEYGEKLSLALKKEQSVMLRLHLFLENQGDEELLKKLEKSVFGKQSHLDAMMDNVDQLYPQLREIVKEKDLGLDQNEQLVVIMSYFNISRQDEALLLNKTTDMVDKIRNRSRKKIQSIPEENKLPKIG